MRDKSKLDRVAAGEKDDRNRDGRRLSRQCRRKSIDGRNHSHLTVNQIGRKSRQSIVLTLCPSIFDCDILPLDVAGFSQASVKGGDCVTERSWRGATYEPNHWHCRLLRARRERPRCRRTAEQRDEIASSEIEHGLLPGTRCASL
jgi:hypothetical protein